MDPSESGFDNKDRELVLGRRTYEIFEAYWPYQPENDPTARALNAAKKYVGRTLTTFDWNNSMLLHGDVVSAIITLKNQPGADLQIIGRGDLIQTLQAASTMRGQAAVRSAADRIRATQSSLCWGRHVLAGRNAHRVA